MRSGEQQWSTSSWRSWAESSSSPSEQQLSLSLQTSRKAEAAHSRRAAPAVPALPAGRSAPPLRRTALSTLPGKEALTQSRVFRGWANSALLFSSHFKSSTPAPLSTATLRSQGCSCFCKFKDDYRSTTSVLNYVRILLISKLMTTLESPVKRVIDTATFLYIFYIYLYV